MSDAGDADDVPRLIRAFFGRPAIWRGASLTALGLGWFVLAVIEGPSTMRIVVGSAWLVLGISEGTVALYDRAHRMGRYARPVTIATPRG